MAKALEQRLIHKFGGAARTAWGSKGSKLWNQINSYANNTANNKAFRPISKGSEWFTALSELKKAGEFIR